MGKKIALMLFVMVFAVVGFSVGFRSYKNTNKACVNCHLMNPQILTWQETSHRKIPCITCHENVNTGLNYIKTFTGRHNELISTAEFIPNTVCEKCHSWQREITAPGDLIIPHNRHLEIGLDCIDCHAEVVHAGIRNRLAVPAMAAKSLTSEEISQMIGSNRISMGKCLECHNGAKAPDQCIACHSDKEIPLNHKNVAWGVDHGRTARMDPASCNRCHEYDPDKQKRFNPNEPSLSAVRKLARGNDFCLNCHGERPKTHTITFSIEHYVRGAVNRAGCLVCHEESDATGNPVTQVTCEQCHKTVHSKGWLMDHRPLVKAEGDKKCYTCHAAVSCGDCHTASRRRQKSL